MTPEKLAKLTPEQKRIRIAELCVSQFNCCRCSFSEEKGGKEVRATLMKYGAPFCSEECAERAGDFSIDDGQQAIPDYLNDLNAMHEAEKRLKPEQSIVYQHTLWQVIPDKCEPINFAHPIHATASHRADTFLLVLG